MPTIPELIKKLQFKKLYRLYDEGDITYYDYREGVLILINNARYAIGLPILNEYQRDRLWQLHTLAAPDWKQARYEIADSINGCNY